MAKAAKEPKFYELISPVTVTYKKTGEANPREETIENVMIRPPTVGDMRMLDNFGDKKMAGTIAMISRLIDLPEAVIDKFDAEDFTNISEIMAAFLPKDPQTGATS